MCLLPGGWGSGDFMARQYISFVTCLYSFGTLTLAWVHEMSMVWSNARCPYLIDLFLGGEVGDWTSRVLRRWEKDVEGKFWTWML